MASGITYRPCAPRFTDSRACADTRVPLEKMSSATSGADQRGGKTDLMGADEIGLLVRGEAIELARIWPNLWERPDARRKGHLGGRVFP